MDMREVDMDEEEALEREDWLRRTVGVATRLVLLEEDITDISCRETTSNAHSLGHG